MSDDYIERIKITYEEICGAHKGIADFRARLLGFLPLASGAGIFIILNKIPAGGKMYLVVVGFFGILVTVGLFLYELRGIQRCNFLIISAKKLESELMGVIKDVGAFNSGYHPANFIVSNTWAAIIIYSTVIGGWAFLLVNGFELGTAGLFIIPAECVLVAGFFAYRFDKLSKRSIERHKKHLKHQFVLWKKMNAKTIDELKVDIPNVIKEVVTEKTPVSIIHNSYHAVIISEAQWIELCINDFHENESDNKT